MDSNKVEGTINEIAGKVQDAAGDVAGNAGAQVAGKARELGGKAQRLYADTTDVVRDKTVESPFTALAIIAGLSFLLGAIWGSAISTSPRAYSKRYRNRF